MQYPALAQGQVLVDYCHALCAGEGFGNGVSREGAQQPGTQQPHFLSRFTQPVHRLPGLGGERAHHVENDVGISSAIGLHGVPPSPEQGLEFIRDAFIDRQGILCRQVRFVTEVGVGAAPQHRYRLTFGGAGGKPDVARVEGRQKARHVCRVRQGDRFPGEGEVEAVEVDQYRQSHARVLCQPVGQQNTVQHLLAVGAVDLQKAAVPRGEDIVVIRLQGYRCRKTAGDVDQHKGRPPAGHGVKHLHGMQQPLAGGGAEDPYPGGGCGARGGEHGVFRFQRHHTAGHFARVHPASQGLDDLGLGCDREGRDVIH